MIRDFDPCQIPVGNRMVRGYRLTCGRCSASSRVAVNTMRDGDNTKTSRMITRKFEQEGWRVGKTGHQDRCPQCLATQQHQKQKVIPMSLPTPSNVTPIVQPTVEKTLGREDRRVIFEKLNDVYVNEKTGYAQTWTDKKVAEDLGVPRAWVATVREEMFGPAGNNEAIAAAAAETEVVLAKITKALEEVRALETRLSKIESALCDEGDKLSRQLKQIMDSLR